MKRIIILLFTILCITAVLSACVGNGVTSVTTPTTNDQGNGSTLQESVTVKFDSAGGGDVQSQLVKRYGYVSKPSDPIRAGYVFEGWYCENVEWDFDHSTVDGDITLYAKWTAISYNVNYELNGGINNKENKSSYATDTGMALHTPTKEDCTFLGWYTDKELTNEITEINKGDIGDKTLYAGWEARTYSVSYELNGGVNNASNPKSFTFYDVITLYEPERDGYMFAGWYTDAECTVPITEIAGVRTDLTLYARWADKVYKVDYALDGGVNDPQNPKLYTHGQHFLLHKPTKSGYTFLGWYLDAELLTEVTEIKYTDKGDKVFYAKWEINTYNITYALDSGINHTSNPESVTVRDVITLKDPTKEYYTFMGWYTDKELTESVTEIRDTEKDLTLYAKWELTTYEITYVVNGATNTLNPKSYVSRDGLVLRSPFRNGYDFLGWYADAEFTTEVTKIESGETGEKTFYAKWRVITYSITYVLNGGVNDTLNPLTYTVNDIINLHAPKKSSYYSFGGWYADPQFNAPVHAIARQSRNMTLYAKWVVNESYVTDPVGVMNSDFTIQLSDSLKKDTYTLKYENDGGVIDKYEPLGTISVGDTLKKFVSVNIAPVEATKIGVYSSKGTRVGSIKIHEDFKLELGEKKYSFGALSDVHIGYNTSEEDFERALKYLSDTEKVKFIGISGDLTRGAKEEQFRIFNELISKHSKVPVYAIAGNHDTPEYGGSGVKELVTKYTGHPLYYSFTYGDDVYIMLGTAKEETGSHLPSGALQWLYETLEENRDKRCFLFTHVYTNNSSGDPYNIYGFDMWYGNEEKIFMSMLDHYPNVTLFHGHSHVEFALQSLASNAIIDVSGHYNSIHIPSLAVPRTGTLADGTIMSNYLYEESEGYVVDVYENGIILRGYDFVNGKFIPSAYYYIDTTLSSVKAGTYRDSLGIIVTKK